MYDASISTRKSISVNRDNTSTSIRTRNFFLLLVREPVLVSLCHTCELDITSTSTREMEVFFVSGQTNVFGPTKEKHRAWICPCACAYLTCVSILCAYMLALMLVRYMWTGLNYPSHSGVQNNSLSVMQAFLKVNTTDHWSSNDQAVILLSISFCSKPSRHVLLLLYSNSHHST